MNTAVFISVLLILFFITKNYLFAFGKTGSDFNHTNIIFNTSCYFFINSLLPLQNLNNFFAIFILHRTYWNKKCVFRNSYFNPDIRSHTRPDALILFLKKNSSLIVYSATNDSLRWVNSHHLTEKIFFFN